MKWTERIAEGIDPGQSAEAQAAAARWFNRFLDHGTSDLSPQELESWAEWCEKNTNLEQFRHVERTWHRLTPMARHSDADPADTEIAADEYDGSVPLSGWLEHSRTRKRWRPGPLSILLLAACITVAMAALVRYGHGWFVERAIGDQVASYATGPSEHRVIDLPDGSTITLGARTQLSTHYTESRRIVFLERGEAGFDVAHDRQRPFSVIAGGGAITAIGTRFDVRRELDAPGLDRVVVIVSNGTVEVGPPLETISKDTTQDTSESPSGSSTDADRKAVDGKRSTGGPAAKARSAQPEWAPARLVKGQELTYDVDGPQGHIENVDLREVSAWKEGRLEYRHTAFKFVIPRVNRYSEKPIVLADDAVGDMPYTGTVFEGQVPEWLRALKTAYPIEVTETPDHIVVRSRPSSLSPGSP
jgi:transmembrane sensor